MLHNKNKHYLIWGNRSISANAKYVSFIQPQLMDFAPIGIRDLKLNFDNNRKIDTESTHIDGPVRRNVQVSVNGSGEIIHNFHPPLTI